MSAAGVTDALVEAIGSGATTSSSPTSPTRTWSATPGVWDATLDGARGHRRVPGARRRRRSTRSTPDDPDAPGALLAITADHGNADELRDAEGRPVTAHSLNPVPFVLVGRVGARRRRSRDGVLADVAPTLLDLAGLPRVGRDDRPLARSCDSIRRRTAQRSLDPWTPFWPSARSS